MKKLSTPFAELLPPLSADEIAALKVRVASEGGVHDPVLVTADGEVLDGHNRLRIDPDCKRKVIPGSGAWTKPEREAFVIRCNLGRRNLSGAQRTEVLKTCRRIAGELKAQKRTQAQIAAAMGVARETVRDWLDAGNNGASANVSTDCRVKVSGPQKTELARRAATGEKPEKIAADFKITPRQVRNIVAKEEQQAEHRREREEAAARAPDNCGVYHEDFRSTKVVAPESVDLILTDPPYDENAVALYDGLASFACRVLRPGAWCLAYSGQAFLPDVLMAMRASLCYGWTFAIKHTGGELRFRKLQLRNGWKPVVGFFKPPLRVYWDWFSDTVTGGAEKDDHEWQQAQSEAEHFISALTVPGALVVDPFCGGGTVPAAAKALGRKWLGFDVDESAVATTRGRLAG